MNNYTLENIRNIIPADSVLEYEDMDMHTSFRTGGPARVFIFVENREQLKNLVTYLNKTGNGYFILGNGTNLLVSDKGYDGIVIKLTGEFIHEKTEGDRVICGSASLLSAAAKAAADAGLSGMEFASGIPGSVGGAVIMNAGAYGGDMSQICETVDVMNAEGEILTLQNASMGFKYRDSVLKGSDYVVLGATFKLTPGDKEEIRSKMAELAAERRSKQPLEFPSAGSTFKRPEGNFAGKLIMDAGMRGFTIGGARVSDKHCGFVVNLGYASSADVYDVIRQVQERVKDRFDVSLEPEVIMLGEF